MKIVELLVENYTQQLEVDLDNLIVAAKARGIDHLKTDELVTQMVQMGYDVNPNSLMTIISNNPAIQTATPMDIQLTPTDDAGLTGAEDPEQSAEKVSQMARKEAERSIK